MVRRSMRVFVAAAIVFVLTPSSVGATPEPEVPRPESTEEAQSSGLIPLPPGCTAPPPADVAFVGTVVAKDEFVEKGTVRYRVDQVRAGDVGPFTVDGLIDVRYGTDSQFIEIEDQLLVSAAVDPTIAALASKVSPEPLLFGGDAVIGVDDTETECPDIDDPVMTVNLDGSPVESSVITPLFEDRRVLLATVAVPAAVVGVVLVGLVLLRRLLDLGLRGVFALGRAAVTPSADHRASRVRRHMADHEAELAFPDEGLDDPDPLAVAGFDPVEDEDDGVERSVDASDVMR